MTLLHPDSIRTETHTLEPLRAAHAEEMAGVLADPKLYLYIGGEPPSVERLRRRYTEMSRGSEEPGVHWCNWVIRTAESEAVGPVQATVGPAPDGPVALLAWIVGTPWQGRGIGTEAVRALIAWLHERGVSPVVAHIHPDNAASQSLARACGLRPTGAWTDGEQVWSETL